MTKPEFWVALIGAAAAIWAAAVSTFQMRMHSRRPTPFFTVERGGVAPPWSGFRAVTMNPINPYPVPFEIASIKVLRDWRNPLRRPKLVSYRHAHRLNADGGTDWLEHPPKGVSNMVRYPGFVVAGSRLASASPDPSAIRLAVAGVKDGQCLSIRYRWLDQRRLMQSTTTI